MPEQFIIHGGHPLNGVLRVNGNKNSALKLIAACLLTSEPVILHNTPKIADVLVMCDILRHLGASVDWVAANSLRIHAEKIKTHQVPTELAKSVRASIVLAGPMLARLGRLDLPAPGGDVIGRRRLDTHMLALTQLGAVIEVDKVFKMNADGLKGADILLDEASVTATENALMAASLATGTTIIRNAACEPHIQDMCNFLNLLGGKVTGIGSNTVTIEGVQKLHGGEFRVGADYLEVGSFVGAAVLTGGELVIQEADPQNLATIAPIMRRLGVEWEVRGNDVFVPRGQSLTISQDLGKRIPQVKAQPWPGFPTDLLSIAIVVATQSMGAVLFHEWMYENRLFFTDSLVSMGARIILCDPHRALIQGPAALQGGLTLTSPDIRAGMSLLLAALSAKGVTTIRNIRQIDRGYERIDERLNSVGARIERVEA
jgi:UDP-N-acetylglucosamine 1-carboxyvinyltransferase